MRVTRFLLSLMIAFSSSTRANSQQSTSAPQRDPQATMTITQGLLSLGGAANLAAIQDCVVTGTMQTSMGNTLPTSITSFAWTVAADEFRQELTAGTTSSVFVSGHGSPLVTRNGSSKPINYHVARANLPFYLPGLVLLNELNNQNVTIRFVGPATAQGRPAVRVHVSDDSDEVGKLVTPQEWYFDAANSLPLRVEFRQPSNQNAAHYSFAAFEFADYRLISGVMVPYQLTYFKDGKPFASVSVSGATVNSGVPSSTFAAATGGAQ